MTSMTPEKIHTDSKTREQDGAIQLSPRRVFRIDQRLGDMEIEALGGTLWMTLPNDPNDYVLRCGDRMSVRTKGTVLLQALTEATFTIN